MSNSGPNDFLEELRQEGPDPEDYKGDWDKFEKDYNDWADKTGFPN